MIGRKAISTSDNKDIGKQAAEGANFKCKKIYGVKLRTLGASPEESISGILPGTQQITNSKCLLWTECVHLKNHALKSQPQHFRM